VNPLRRWVAAWAALEHSDCRLNGCHEAAAAVFEAYSWGLPTLFYVCADHVELVEAAGYEVTWPPTPVG
jgi:hypothetical protein